MADLLNIFRCKTINALRKMFMKPDQRTRDPSEDSRLYHQYNRGEKLPGENEVAKWLVPCAQADRINKLPLWEVIGARGDCSDEWLSSIIRRLASNVRAILDEAMNNDSLGPDGPPILIDRTEIEPLVQDCSIDALTALLALIDYYRANPDAYHYADLFYDRESAEAHDHVALLGLAAMETFLRLSVFPPFQAVRRQFYSHICKDFFIHFKTDGLLTFEFMFEQGFLESTDETINCLKGLGRMGLVGKSLSEQVAFVNRIRGLADDETFNEILRICFADQPAVIQPTDPAYLALKRIHLVSASSNQPIELPLNGCYVEDFAIANALGKAVVDWSLCKKGRVASGAASHRPLG